MQLVNKTRYAILGVLLEGPATGYEIKSLMGRSTVYFWRESDSTIYPMLKVLVKEGKVLSEVVYVGKKKKEIFSITQLGKEEFKTWLKSPTSEETPRNEFLLKLFFVSDRKEMIRLFQERLEKAEKTYEEYKKIEDRLGSLRDYRQKAIRLKALRYGLTQLTSEITWLKEGILEYAHC
jgi:PadR family transcriptional regulator, regulatory protein AphA